MKIAVATACGALEAVGSEFAAAVGGVAAEAGGMVSQALSVGLSRAA